MNLKQKMWTRVPTTTTIASITIYNFTYSYVASVGVFNKIQFQAKYIYII